MELMAQIVEEVSVVASGHKRKKPREVPRPDHLKGGAVPSRTGNVVQIDGYRKAIGVLASTKRGK